MPNILKVGPYRFYFYSHEPNEPIHVHVDRDDSSAKVWLEPIQLARNFGFNAKELHQIIKTVRLNQDILKKAWYGHFSDRSR